jgi:hypothetical protein
LNYAQLLTRTPPASRTPDQIRAFMKRFIIAFLTTMIGVTPVALVAGGFDLKATNLGAGKMLVLATNISGDIRGFCVWESSSNLVTWTPVLTNSVNKTWATNIFSTTNSMSFYRAWVY